jgi:hypothetical protein
MAINGKDIYDKITSAMGIGSKKPDPLDEYMRDSLNLGGELEAFMLGKQGHPEYLGLPAAEIGSGLLSGSMVGPVIMPPRTPGRMGHNFGAGVNAQPRRRTPLEMITMRLHIHTDEGMLLTIPGLNWIDAYVTDTKAVVFVVDKNEKTVMLEEADPLLFPSDTLISQLRLIMG